MQIQIKYQQQCWGVSKDKCLCRQSDFHDDSTDLFCSAGTMLTFFQSSTFRKCNVCADVGFDTDIHDLQRIIDFNQSACSEANEIWFQNLDTQSFLNCGYQLPYRSDTHRVFKIGGHTHTQLYVLRRQLQTVTHLLSPTQQHLCRCIVRITDWH